MSFIAIVWLYSALVVQLCVLDVYIIRIHIHYTYMKFLFSIWGFQKARGACGFGARSAAAMAMKLGAPSSVQLLAGGLSSRSSSNLCVCSLLRSLFSSDFCPITKRGHTIQLLPWTLLGSFNNSVTPPSLSNVYNRHGGG